MEVKYIYMEIKRSLLEKNLFQKNLWKAQDRLRARQERR